MAIVTADRSARRRACISALVALAVLASCGDGAVEGLSESTTATRPASDIVGLDSIGTVTTARVAVSTTSSQLDALSTSTTRTGAATNDGVLRVEQASVSAGSVCAKVSLDGTVSTFCSPRDSFAWSIGERVFVFAVGPELRLRDGRVLAPEQGDNFVVHEIVDANIDSPVHDEPDFCPLTLIAYAFQRYAPDESFGWGGDACISDEILGLGTIAGVDQAGYSEVMGGGGGSDRFVGFVARLDGIWTVLEVVPYETFADCDDLSVLMAREICARSPISWNTAATS